MLATKHPNSLLYRVIQDVHFSEETLIDLKMKCYVLYEDRVTVDFLHEEGEFEFSSTNDELLYVKEGGTIFLGDWFPSCMYETFEHPCSIVESKTDETTVKRL